MPINLDTTNTWLAVIAIAIVVQTLVVIAGAAVAWRTMQHTAETLQRLEDRHLTPLSARVQEVSARVQVVADDVQDVMGRVRRADDAVRAQLSRLDGVATAANVAGQAIGAKVWPVVGFSRAVGAALRAFASRPSTSPSPSPSPSPETPRAARVTPR
jgi:uncharacterized protein YoxC